MRSLGVVAAMVLMAFAAACARGADGADGPPGDGGTHVEASAPVGPDGSNAASDATSDLGPDAAPADDAAAAGDSGNDAPIADAGAAANDGGLSPLLALPDPGGSPCTELGTGNDCPSGEVCRIASTTAGRCEDCTGACGGPGAACTASKDCDTLYQCYSGHCRGICPLNGGGGCAASATCIDVGNQTYGVCSK